MSDSPLTEAKPELSLPELFARDPEELTRPQRDIIVRELRRARENFAEGEAREKIKKPREPKKALTLDELFGGDLK